MKIGLLAHMKDTVPGLVGNGVIVAAGTTSWFAKADPAMHFFSVLVGIVASIATTVYYITKYRSERRK